MKTLTISITLVLALVSCKHFEPEKLEREPGQEGSRQIHLDFHTSEQLEHIGEQFDKKQFQDALIAGNVNSINIFAKGHHSWSYYPTEVGRMHPHLDFDLMGAQIEACKEIGVSVQLYYTVGWSANDAINHPEWAVARRDGSSDYKDMVSRLGDYDDFWGWEYLPPEGPYADLILAQTEELLENYEVDGIWYDIHQPERLNYNAYSLEDLKAHGIDPNDTEAVRKRTNERYHEFFSKSHNLVKSHNENASVYYNGTTRTYNDENIAYFKYGFFKYNTKQDLEDLPTSWAGYDIFPWRSKYFAGTGKELVAMSGKFHKSWGEFGGFKDKEAILYEAASMIAFGAHCNFGDQLHPSGIMDMATYENIGYAYDYVEQIEAYGIGGKSAARTGLYVSESKSATEGTVNMLLESQVNFNIVNLLDDWSEFEVLIVTSGGIHHEDQEKLSRYLEQGGKLIVMAKGAFLDGRPIADIGAGYRGNANYDVDYTVAGAEIIEGLVPSPFLNYRAAIRVLPEEGTKVLAHIREPYFSRTIHHYTSHKNTPYRLENADHPAVIRKDNVIFLAHDLDKQYYREGARLQRDIFINCLNLLRTDPYVTVDMPSMGRINLLKQEEKDRYVLHLLYGSPIQRGSVRVVEDLVPLYDIPVSVHIEEEIRNAYLIPSGKKVKLKREEGRYNAIIPALHCHTGLVIEYR